jgi:hypothetical protein
LRRRRHLPEPTSTMRQKKSISKKTVSSLEAFRRFYKKNKKKTVSSLVLTHRIVIAIDGIYLLRHITREHLLKEKAQYSWPPQ